MRIRSIVMAALLVGGSMAFAQVCPPSPAGTVCLVPPRNMTVLPSTSGTNVAMVSPTVIPAGTVVYQITPVPTTTQVASATLPSSTCPASVSPDTACLINQVAALQGEVRALRGDMYASSLESQGQSLVSRMNQLEASETAFRQQLAANPNLPGAQATAAQLQAQANTLNNDIAAYNSQLAAVPPSMQPYMAQRVASFQNTYWIPATQRFAMYSSQFPQSQMTYQTAANTTPELGQFYTNYQTALNNISTSVSMPTTTTTVASAWWLQPQMQVAGTTEVYPGGGMAIPQGWSAMQLSDGSIVLLPPGYSISPMSGGMMGTPNMMGTSPMGTTGMYTGTNAY